MNLNVRLFFNTGFNLMNTPGEISVLNSARYADYPSIELNTRHPDSIRIYATENDLEGVDFCCLYDSTMAVYFSVGKIIPLDSGTVELPLVIEPLLSVGGISAIEVLDGITERHHVATADDTFGAYCEEDSYLVASKPLEMVTGGSFPALSGSKLIIAQSTAKLTQMGFAKDEPLAKKFVQYESGVEVDSVPVPTVTPVERQGFSKTSMEGIGTDSIPGMALYVLDDGNSNSNVGEVSSDGIGVLQSLGQEGAVKNCYSIPKEYIYNDGVYTTFTDNVEKADGTTGTVANEHIDTITGKANRSVSVTAIPNMEYEYANVHNKRVLYGEMNKYGLVAKATGDGCTYKPEEIYHEGDTRPTVKMFANPAPDGCPYFRFEYLNGNTDNPFMNCITGAVWQNAPLIFTDKSGSVLDTIKLQASQSIKQDQLDIETAGAKGLINVAKGRGIASALTGGEMMYNMLSMNEYGGPMPRTTISAGEQDYLATVNSSTLQRRRALAQEQAMENLSLAVSQVVAPTVNFPRSSGLRDYVGNNVFVYRYRPHATDLAKQDKILTMYGYRDTAPLTKAMLNNRSKFNYIKASGVSFKTITNIPKWLRDELSAMFNNGVRIWHVLPDTTAYTNGTNV